MRLSTCLAATIVSILPLVSAQQYAGDVISNTLPSVPGSEITYFRIRDPTGKNSNLTLTNYYSLGKSKQRLVESKVKRAVIIIHGINRDPGTYMSNMLSALSQSKDPNIDFDSVAIIAPYFPNGEDKNKGYPWTEGLKAGRGSTTNALVWPGSQWAAGGNNQYPYTSTNTSSYNVLDQIIQYFDNTAMFPEMKQIVVAGHSLGAQAVQRYAAIGAQLGTRSPVSYWIANPNSYVWLSTSRPMSISSCPSYDNYREGLSNFVDYPMTYATNLVAQGRAAVLANYQAKAINYVRGTQDLGDTSSTCAPSTTGANRNERFFNYIKAFPASCPDPAGRNCDTVDFVNAGHDAGTIMASAAGQARLFSDNFYGNGNRSFDFGYPRQQAGDDPYPDPTLYASSASMNSQTYAGMTYWGCWSDQSPQTLVNMTFQSNTNTIGRCAEACASGNNTIAGMEFGTQCFCGKVLGYKATQFIDSSCSMACPGNSSEVCGGSQRLSLFSAGTPKLLPTPGTPDTAGDFYYSGCYTEASLGRALTGKGTTSDSMSLEVCAGFCSGYQYFGTEYGTECYCGNTFNGGANRTSAGECSMTCANDPAQLCGAGNRLTVYQDPDWTAVTSSSPSSLSTTRTSTSSTITADGTNPSSSAIVACPGSNNTIVSFSDRRYLIECGIDHSGGDLTSLGVSSFSQCIEACAKNVQCVDVSLSGAACYLKSVLGVAVPNGGVWGAKLISILSESPSTVDGVMTWTSSSTLMSLMSKVSTIMPLTSSTSSSDQTSRMIPSSNLPSTSTLIAVESSATVSTQLVTSSSSTAAVPSSSQLASSASTAPVMSGLITSTAQLSTSSTSTTITSSSTTLSSVGTGSVSTTSNNESQALSSSFTTPSSHSPSTVSTSSITTTISSLVSPSSRSSTSSTAPSSAIPSVTITTSSTTTSSSSSTKIIPSTTSLNCPSSNTTAYTSSSTSFLIECGIDYTGGDFQSAIFKNFQQCIDACATTSGCAAVAYSGVACYLKSRVGPANRNGVWGARVVVLPSVSGEVSRTISESSAVISGATITGSLAGVPTSLSISSRAFTCGC